MYIGTLTLTFNMVTLYQNRVGIMYIKTNIYTIFSRFKLVNFLINIIIQLMKVFIVVIWIFHIIK